MMRLRPRKLRRRKIFRFTFTCAWCWFDVWANERAALPVVHICVGQNLYIFFIVIFFIAFGLFLSLKTSVFVCVRQTCKCTNDGRYAISIASGSSVLHSNTVYSLTGLAWPDPAQHLQFSNIIFHRSPHTIYHIAWRCSSAFRDNKRLSSCLLVTVPRLVQCTISTRSIPRFNHIFSLWILAQSSHSNTQKIGDYSVCGIRSVRFVEIHREYYQIRAPQAAAAATSANSNSSLISFNEIILPCVSVNVRSHAWQQIEFN